MDGMGLYADLNPRSRKSINFGYIVVPSDVDRNSFIAKCKRENRVSIFVEKGGGLHNNCRITKEALKNVEFPKVGEKLGSMVCFFSEPFGNQIFIVGTLPNTEQVEEIKEGVDQTSKTSDNGSASIYVDSDGVINIDIDSHLPESGKLNINIHNQQKTAEFNLKVKGSINLYTEGDLNIRNVDGNLNIDCDSIVNINSSKLILNGGFESGLLGDKTQTELNKERKALTDIINIFKNIIAQPVGAGSPDATWQVVSQQIQQIIDRGDFSEIKSSKLFLK